VESTSERASRVALAVVQRAIAQTQMVAGAALNLPLYEPANPAHSSAVLALVDALRRADGIIADPDSDLTKIYGLISS
jgi:FMN reductase